MSTIQCLAAALAPVAAIAEAYEAGRLPQARPEDGQAPRGVALCTSRGGVTLLSLADAIAVRRAIETGFDLEDAATPLANVMRAYNSNELDRPARKFDADMIRSTLPLEQIAIVPGAGDAVLLNLGQVHEAWSWWLVIRDERAAA